MATPIELQQAKVKAAELCARAFGPQPVKKLNGDVLHLCWEGRLTRAVVMAGEASGDEAKLAKMRNGITKLSEMAKKAENAANEAASHYAALCATAGTEPDNVYPPSCQCEGCKLKERQANYFAAEDALRSAIFELMAPRDARDPLPFLAKLIDNSDKPDVRDRLWWKLKAIADAQKTYAEACEAFGQRPYWERTAGLA